MSESKRDLYRRQSAEARDTLASLPTWMQRNLDPTTGRGKRHGSLNRADHEGCNPDECGVRWMFDKIDSAGPSK